MQLFHFPVLILLVLALIAGGNAKKRPRTTLTADKNTTDVSGEVKLRCTYTGVLHNIKYEWCLDGDWEQDLGNSSESTLQYKPGMEKRVIVRCVVKSWLGNQLSPQSNPVIIRFTGPMPTITADKNTTDRSGEVKLTCTYNGQQDAGVKYKWFVRNWERNDLGTRRVSTLQYKHVVDKRGGVSCLVTDMDDNPITLVADPVNIRFTVSRATVTADKNTTDVSGEVELTCTYNGQKDVGVKYEWILDGDREQDLGNSSVSTLQYKPEMEKIVNVRCLVTDMDGNPITLRADPVIIHFTVSRATLTADKNTTDVSGEVKLTCTNAEHEDTDVKYEWFVDGDREQDLGNSSVSTLQYKPAMEKTLNVSCLVTDMDGNRITRAADRVMIRFTGSSAVCIGSGVILPLLLVVTSYMSVW